ncbi:MAG: cell surface protein [Bacteroidetes bacterium]|nr:MAG: cell surface protein [Bacteroidota bacterium]
MKEDHLGIGRGDLPVKSHEGLFITCEGNFTYNNASLSYYDIAHKEVYNEVFFTVNGLSLGDVAQSVVLRDSLLYVVVNNSGKIIVLDADDFSFKKKITGFTSPRYIHFLSREKAYVTDLYAHAIAIVDLEEDTISGYISVHNTLSAFNQHPTEQMVAIGNRVFVNCWSYDRKILVIDSDRDKVIDSVAVAKQPNSMVLDKYNRLWVLSDGGYPGSPYGQEHPALTCIEPYSLSIIDTIMMDMADAPSELAINGTRDTLFFLNGDLYYMAVVGMDAPEIFVESPYEQSYMGGFYGLGVDPATSEVYVADAIDYNQPGVVYRYSPHAMPLDTFQVGIIPGAFCFKEKMLPSNSTIQRR